MRLEHLTPAHVRRAVEIYLRTDRPSRLQEARFSYMGGDRPDHI